MATPHSEHRDHALLAIGAGRHVLVEKAFTRNEAEAREVLDAAAAAGVFAMEAMWTRFLPHVDALHRVLDEGRIGEVVSFSADHGQWFPYDARHRLFAPELAGGALLDLGVYAVSLRPRLPGPARDHRGRRRAGRDRRGRPGQRRARVRRAHPGGGERHPLGGDPHARGHLRHRGPDRGGGPLLPRPSFTVIPRQGEPWTFSHPLVQGLQYEAAEVARRVAAGERESPRMSWRSTLEVMHTMDEIRAQIGVAYPGE